MRIVSNSVNYLDEGVVLEGFFALDEAVTGQRPAVLVSHAWGGRDGFALDKAKQLAELGYVGFALDMYGAGVLGETTAQKAALMQPFMDDRAMLLRRILAAVKTVSLMPWVDPNRIAAIGFCFGGLCVLDLARSGADVKGVVSFHGLLASSGLAPQPVKAKVLALHGHDDPLSSIEQVRAFEAEMTAAGADWQLHAYGGTQHAFTNPVANDPALGLLYNPTADKRSWQTMQNFLAEVFAKEE